MRRNKYDDREKLIRELERIRDENWDVGSLRYHRKSGSAPREQPYILLEKPQFAGWDLTLVLSNSCLRRRDAPKLNAILSLLEASKPVFTKQEKLIRHIRLHNHDWNTLRSLPVKGEKYSVWDSTSYYSRYTHRYNYIWDYIPSKVYNNLSEEYKAFFSKDPVKDNQKLYHQLTYRFPTYEIRVKVTKSYWNKTYLPFSEEDSIYKKVSDKLDHSFHHRWGNDSYESWDHYYERRRKRRKWNMFTSQYKYGWVDEWDQYIEAEYDFEEDMYCHYFTVWNTEDTLEDILRIKCKVDRHNS